MGTIKTTNIEPIADNGTVTLGSSGDTFTIPSGVTMVNNGTQTGFGGVNTPAFEAYDESIQSMSDYTWTKLDVATENFDTNNNFDNSAMRFTPTVAGKYFLYAKGDCDASGYEDMRSSEVAFYKNGSIVTYTNARVLQGGNTSNAGTVSANFTSVTLTLNGSSDYVEIYGRINALDNSNVSVMNTIFGGYKIIE